MLTKFKEILNLIIRSGNSIENFVNTHFGHLWLNSVFTNSKDVFPPPKLLCQDCVSLLSSLHVLVNQGDGHQQVPLVAEDGPGQKHYKAANSSILKIRYLKFTRPGGVKNDYFSL